MSIIALELLDSQRSMSWGTVESHSFHLIKEILCLCRALKFPISLNLLANPCSYKVRVYHRTVDKVFWLRQRGTDSASKQQKHKINHKAIDSWLLEFPVHWLIISYRIIHKYPVMKKWNGDINNWSLII